MNFPAVQDKKPEKIWLAWCFRSLQSCQRALNTAFCILSFFWLCNSKSRRKSNLRTMLLLHCVLELFVILPQPRSVFTYIILLVLLKLFTFTIIHFVWLRVADLYSLCLIFLQLPHNYQEDFRVLTLFACAGQQRKTMPSSLWEPQTSLVPKLWSASSVITQRGSHILALDCAPMSGIHLKSTKPMLAVAVSTWLTSLRQPLATRRRLRERNRVRECEWWEEKATDDRQWTKTHARLAFRGRMTFFGLLFRFLKVKTRRSQSNADFTPIKWILQLSSE